MAKINRRTVGGRRTHQVGPTLFTEREREPMFDGDVTTVYYEAWRLRSDGVVQSRIVRTWPKDGTGNPTEHSSGFTNFATLKVVDSNLTGLRRWLERKGAVIVKEQYR